MEPLRPCRCGHTHDVHEHYREGTDCARCSCAAFHEPSGRPVLSPELRRLVGFTLGVPVAVVAVVALMAWAQGDQVPVVVAVLLAVSSGVITCWLIRPDPPEDHDDEC